MLVVLPFDCVGKVISYVACCIIQIGADPRANDVIVKWQRLVFKSWIVAEEGSRLLRRLINS